MTPTLLVRAIRFFHFPAMYLCLRHSNSRLLGFGLLPRNSETPKRIGPNRPAPSDGSPSPTAPADFPPHAQDSVDELLIKHPQAFDREAQLNQIDGPDVDFDGPLHFRRRLLGVVAFLHPAPRFRDTPSIPVTSADCPGRFSAPRTAGSRISADA